jgi:hypothetical protein
MASVVPNKMPFVLISNLVIQTGLKQYGAMCFSFLFYDVVQSGAIVHMNI